MLSGFGAVGLSLLNYLSRFLYGNHADVAGYPQVSAGDQQHLHHDLHVEAIFVAMAAVA